VCAGPGSCAYCNEITDPKYESSCELELECPVEGFEGQYIHDYNPEGVRCSDECSAPNSVYSI